MTTAVLLILGWLTCFVALNALLKQGVVELTLAEGFWHLVREVASSPWAYLAVALYVACAVFYLVALRHLPLSIAGPAYMTLGVLSTALTGVLFFSEPVTAPTVIGVALCLCGVLVLALGGGGASA